MKHENNRSVTINEENYTTQTLSDRDVFSIHNSFNQTKSQLSQLALDIFFLLVTQIKIEDDELFLYETSLSEIQRKLGRRIKIESIKEAGQELLDTDFVFKIDDALIHTQLLSIFEYNGGTVYLKLNDNLIDIVINPRKAYTVASFKELVSLKSVYTKRIYLLLKQFAASKEFVMHLSHIYKILNLENKYERYSHFKSKILNPAIKSINEQTSLKISIYEHLKNRTVQRIKFDINSPLKQPKIPKYKKNSSLKNLIDWVNQDQPINAQEVSKYKESRSDFYSLMDWVHQEQFIDTEVA
ncbi:MAG: hypothetical protein C0627_03370 [Sulfurimonas sp.]|nr:MAG: hypothetical protein C0627_03370 [Sulfurimonas sp.]